MGVKNVNFFEQNVEKIVLGVAAAGALFMGYLAVRPITIPVPSGLSSPSGSEELKPSEIEDLIEGQLRKVEAQQQQLPDPNPVIPPYLERYRKVAVGDPLEVAIANPAVTSFGPKNLSPKAVNIEGTDTKIQWATPAPVAPEYLRVEARQDQVAAVAIDPANPIPAGMQVQTRTLNSVVIDGYVPLGKMMAEMLQDKYKDIIAQQGVQRAQVYRIAVERQEQLPTGWSEWKAVPPTKASLQPTEVNWGVMKDGDLPATMDLIDNEFKQIVIPDFYQDGQGIVIAPPILSRAVPEKILQETKTLQDLIDQHKAPTGFRPVTPTPMTPVVPGAPGAATQPTTLPADAPTLKALAVVPFTFWDETVQSNHIYRYRVEIQITNPTYGWQWGLKDQKMKTVPILSTGKVLIPTPVKVLADTEFFISVSSIDSADVAVSGMIFKQNNGKWYQGSFNALRGQKISAPITLADEANKTIEVDTGYTVVDSIARRDESRVILKDPAGNLIALDPRVDWNRPEKQNLLDKVQQRRAAATTPAGGDIMVTTPGATPAPTGFVPTYQNPVPATVPGRGPTTRQIPVRP